jgi:hypothetical protein
MTDKPIHFARHWLGADRDKAPENSVNHFAVETHTLSFDRGPNRESKLTICLGRNRAELELKEGLVDEEASDAISK